MKIAVIGNGPVKSHLGKIIDGFDFVVRVNAFKKGYEKYIGSKTSAVVLGVPVKVDIGENCQVWGGFPNHSYNVLYDYVNKWYSNRIIKMDRAVIINLQAKLNYPIPSRFASTGLVSIEICIDKFNDHLPIYVAGFTFNPKDGHISNKNAYKNTCYDYHNWERELQYFNKLIISKKIINLEGIV